MAGYIGQATLQTLIGEVFRDFVHVYKTVYIGALLIFSWNSESR